MRRSATSAGAFCSSIVLAVACDADSGDASDEGVSRRGCESEERDDEYALGLEKSGALACVQFVDALPAPPDRGDNTWTLRALDLATAAPMRDMTLVVDPYMPDHMHNTSIPVEVRPMEEPEQGNDEVAFSCCVDP